MYSEKVVAASVEALCQAYKLPKGVREYSVPEVDSWVKRLSSARGPKGEELREVTPEEAAFMRNEFILSKCSYRYWAERYAFVSTQGAGVRRMYPLFDSQELALAQLGRIEEQSAESGDGILVNALKARRLGMSTFAQSLMCHRTTLQTHLYGVTASDVPEQSSYTFGMFRRMYEYLPWWLKPKLRSFANTYPEDYEFDNGSQVWCHSGKSTRGTEGERGQLGRGKGLSLAHLTELSTWDDTDQIDTALLPTLEPSPRLLVIFESSPRGRNNWWHRHWDVSVGGEGRFKPLFLPWYAEPKKYRKAAPPGWSPKAATLAHARRCEEQAPQWLGKRVTLTRDQLYWYESAKAYYLAKDRLGDFLQEYAADPEECFVYSGRGLFGLEVIQRITDQARPLVGALEVVPAMDVPARQS